MLERLQGCTWLLTGGVGFLGSVFLEQLLRTCSPRRVVLVVRKKRGVPGQERVRLLLGGRLFEHVREQYGGVDRLLQRCEVVEWDLAAPACDWQPPAVDFIVHAAADISFSTHIHDAIRSNFKVTERLAASAAKMPSLRGFVHISTCFVSTGPSGSRVPERLAPLEVDGKAVDCQKVVSELLSLPPDQAEKRASWYCSKLGHPFNYMLTKRLTEHMLAERQQQGLPLGILRTSLLGCTSRHHPLPGYVASLSGATGAIMIIALGMDTITLWDPHHVVDQMPIDYAASAIFVAAAALDGGTHRPLILQCASSAVDPLQHWKHYDAIIRKYCQSPPPFALFPGYPLPRLQDIHAKSALEYRLAGLWADLGVWLRCLGLRLVWQHRAARFLASRWALFRCGGRPEMDYNHIWSCDNLAQLYNSLAPEEQALFPCVWRKGIDSWDDYMDLYVESAWKTYLDFAVRQCMPWS